MENSNENQFTVLENSTIGRNISLYRKLRGIKAIEIAEKLNLSEAGYTRYERGESAITINLIQKVAEILKVDPLNLMSISPCNFIDSGNNSTNTVLSMNNSNWQAVNEEQLKLTMKLIENVSSLSEKLIEILQKGK